MNPVIKMLLAPLVLLVLSWQALLAVGKLDPQYHSLLLQLPYAIVVLGVLLAHQFNRSRTVAALLSLALAYWAIQDFLQASLALPEPLFVYTALSIALPLMTLIVLIAPERGLWNRFGLSLVLSPLLCLLAIYGVFIYLPDFQHPLADYFAVKPLPDYTLSLGASLWFALVFVGGSVLAFKRPHGSELAFVVTLLVGFVALAWLQEKHISTVMFSAAALNLLIDLLRTSYSMAYRDDLTGLLGRRALNEKLRGLGKKYVIAMLDVDHFKKFNDTHGHDVGDDVLKMVAAQIGKVEGGGIPYRYGGEEFAVIFPRKELGQCLPHLEAVRLGVEYYKISLRDKKQRPKDKARGAQLRGKKASPKLVSVTISIGVAARDDQHESPEAVLKAADKALYKSKQNGRNCVSS